MEAIDSTSALRRAVAAVKTQAKFAEAIGASQQLVSYLLRRGRPLSPQFVLAAEKATGVSRSLLRPDLYPDNLEVAAPISRVACDPLSASNAYHVSDNPAGRAAAEAPAALVDRSPIPSPSAEAQA